MALLLADLTIRVLVVVWVYTDAKKRDWDGDRFANKPWKWALGVGTIWVIAMPLYLMRRRHRPVYSTLILP